VPAILLSREEKPPPPILPLESDSAVQIDPATNRVVDAVAINGAGLVARDGEALWVASGNDPVLTRIDSRTGAIIERIDVSRLGVPGFLAAGEGGAWLGRVAGSGADKLWKVDRQSGSFEPLPHHFFPPPYGVAVGEGAVWVNVTKNIVRIDPASGEIVSTTDLTKTGACDCLTGTTAAGEGGVWVVGGAALADTVLWLNIETGAVSSLEVGAQIEDLATGNGGVWTTTLDEDAVAQIDPQTNRVVQTIEVGRIPGSVAVGDGSIWVASSRDKIVTRVDPATADLTTIDVGGVPKDIAAGGGAVWVTVGVP
jgi:streptogramin lyase